MKRQRVGIGGLGILTSIGYNVATFSTSIKSGRSGIGKSTIFEKNGLNCFIAAEIREFDFAQSVSQLETSDAAIKQGMLKLGARSSFTIQTSLIAAGQAIVLTAIIWPTLTKRDRRGPCDRQ